MEVDHHVNGAPRGSAKQRPPWAWTPKKRCIQPGDPFFEDGDIMCNIAIKKVPLEETEDLFDKRVFEITCGVSGCRKEFSSIKSYEVHYNSCHRHVCSTCRKFFVSAHLLEIHVLEIHDTMFTLLAAKQDMYQCLVEDCKKKFSNAKVRRQHLIKEHKYPPNFRFGQARKPKVPKVKESNNKPAPTEVPMEAACSVDTMDTLPRVGAAVSQATEQNKTGQSPVSSSGRVFSYRVPKNICFGAGAPRGFARGSRGKRRQKHWHQAKPEGMDTTVHIEDVALDDLSKALDAT